MIKRSQSDQTSFVTRLISLRLKFLDSSLTTDSSGKGAEMEATAELVERVRQHDEQAARALAEQLYPVIAPVVLANLRRRDDAKDLMQDVMLKIFSRLDQFRGEVPLEHWVRRIALTTCFDRLRRQKARPEQLFADLSESEKTALEAAHAPDGAPEPDAADALTLLKRLLDLLPPQEAWLLRRVELENKSIADLCAETGWNAGAARVRLFRARLRLKAEFRKMERHQDE